jgi:hypothetical protein
MYQSPGEKYIRSHKFNLLYSLITLAAAFFLAIGIGRLYAVISIINPIIYLNFLVLIGAAFSLIALIMMVKLFGKSRNIVVDIFSCLFICLTAWFAHWAHIQNSEHGGEGFWIHFKKISSLLSFITEFAENRNISIGRFGSSGMGINSGILVLCYFIEFLAFVAPAYFILVQKEYFCESCTDNYSNTTFYTDNDAILHKHADLFGKGDLGFLSGTPLFKSLDYLPLDPKEKPEIGIIEFHHCNKCNLNSIVNIKSAIMRLNDKQKRETANSNLLLEDTYINDSSHKLLSTGLL